MSISALAIPAAVKALPWRWIALGAAVLLLAFMLWRLLAAHVDAVADARKAGYEAGQAATLARWHKGNEAAALKSLNDVLANQKRQQDAEAARDHRLEATLARMKPHEEKIDVWRATPEAAVDCLGPGAVRLLEQRRDAGNDPGRASAAPANR